MPEAVKKTAEDIMQAARARLEALFLSVGMPESHGVSHCLTVLGHMDLALASTALTPEVRDLLTPRRQLSLRLAALLHEADDHKYFKADSKNATNIMREVLSTESECSEVIREVEEMISYVSASANGNTVPEPAQKDPTLLWPRFCDRLEAIGVIGAVRCYQYNTEKGDPLVSKATPRPTTESEVWAAVTPERWAGYQRGGNSSSMMDHYYDKLLQIAVFPPEVVRCPPLEQEAARRVKPLVDICLEHGRTGEAPVELIRSFEGRVC